MSAVSRVPHTGHANANAERSSDRRGGTTEGGSAGGAIGGASTRSRSSRRTPPCVIGSKRGRANGSLNANSASASGARSALGAFPRGAGTGKRVWQSEQRISRPIQSSVTWMRVEQTGHTVATYFGDCAALGGAVGVSPRAATFPKSDDSSIPSMATGITRGVATGSERGGAMPSSGSTRAAGDRPPPDAADVLGSTRIHEWQSGHAACVPRFDSDTENRVPHTGQLRSMRGARGGTGRTFPSGGAARGAVEPGRSGSAADGEERRASKLDPDAFRSGGPPGIVTAAPHRGHPTASPGFPPGALIFPPQAGHGNRGGPVTRRIP